MAGDELCCGLLRWPYRISRRCWYRQALQLSRMVSDLDEQRDARALTRLLLARAALHLGDVARAQRRFARLLEDNGGSGFVRGHAARYLACLAADRGARDQVDALLARAGEEFRDSESEVEQIDV